jgi:hypothetical protein
LAKETFPALEPHVRRFVHWRDWAIRFAVVWLVLTALTSWDVGHGRSVLDRLDQNWKARAAELQTFPELADPSLCKLHEPGETNLSITPAPPKDPKTGEAKLPDQKTLDEIKRLAPHCARLWNLDKSREDSRADLDRVFLCSDMHWFVKPLHIWCWSDILAGSVEPPRPEELTEKPKTPRVHWQSATSILSVFTTYILPMMFGLLGTLIGAFCSIINRIRDSELAPRDFAGMKLGIPMGLVAGIAVGLFFSPSSVPVQGSGAVAGDLTLTASGLGFLAGYASQTFFHFIDDLLKPVFPDSGAAAPPSTAASTHVIVRSPAAPPAQQPGEGQQAGGQQPGGGHAD